MLQDNVTRDEQFRRLLHFKRNSSFNVILQKLAVALELQNWSRRRLIEPVFYAFVVVAVALYLQPKVLRSPYVTPTTTDPTPAAAPQFFWRRKVIFVIPSLCVMCRECRQVPWSFATPGCKFWPDRCFEALIPKICIFGTQFKVAKT